MRNTTKEKCLRIGLEKENIETKSNSGGPEKRKQTQKLSFPDFAESNEDKDFTEGNTASTRLENTAPNRCHQKAAKLIH